MLALRKKPLDERKEVQTTYLHDPTGMRLNETEQQEETDKHQQDVSTGQGEERRARRQERGV